MELPFEGIRILQAFLVQMDGQLEVRGRRPVSVGRLLPLAADRACCASGILRHYKMAACSDPGVLEAAKPSTCKQGSSHDRSKSNARLCAHVDSQRDDDRLSLCKKPALPILRVHCLVYALLALARRLTSNPDIRGLGCGRVGLECLPKH